MYYLPEPPYFLLVFGLFVGLTSGLAFEATLKQKAQIWLKGAEPLKSNELQRIELVLPFLGICSGICLFLASGLEIFSFMPSISYLVAIPLTIFTGSLVWSQLSKVLQQLKQGGSQALDLDDF